MIEMGVMSYNDAISDHYLDTVNFIDPGYYCISNYERGWHCVPFNLTLTSYSIVTFLKMPGFILFSTAVFVQYQHLHVYKRLHICAY